MILLNFHECATVAGSTVQVKFPLTVVLLGLSLGAGWATPARERPAGRLAPTAPAAFATPAPAPIAASASSTGTATTATAPAASSEPPVTPTGSAYVGCGEPIPHARLWDETTESEVLEAISVAKACAAEHGRRLLLEFVAPWCDDCQEMATLDETPLVARTLRERFERVRVNVGKWDRHEGLRQSFGVRALATYVVIDPKTSKQLAKTTLEPITKKRGKKLTAEDWASWLREH
jgi:hypothetical protein